MSTQQRVDSSRANGAKSRGPVTPEGRARSRAARLTHGLTSADLLINGESQEEFNAFREEYLADYQPQTRPQFDLVDQLVAIRWRLNRVIALQGALMDIQIERQQPEIDREFEGGGGIRAAIAYQHLCDDSRGLESLHRREARLSAELRLTFKLLAAELKNQKFHHEPSDAQPTFSDEDRGAAEAPPSTTDPLGAAGDGRPPTRLSCRPSPDSCLHEFHHEPSDATPPRSDEDGEGAPPSTTNHPPSSVADS
jgi:hypothetical protein